MLEAREVNEDRSRLLCCYLTTLAHRSFGNTKNRNLPLHLSYLLSTVISQSSHPVIIVGGGVAGLSAAVHLAAAGRAVHLIDRRQHLGGRTYSWRDDVTGDTVDNGQHLMMGCYSETLRYLDLIGSRRLARLQPSLRIDFADVASGRRAALRAGWLPAPLHVFTGLLGLSTLSMADKLRLFPLGIELLWSAPWKEYALQHMSVEYWLKELKQSETARRHLWDVIAVGSLNDHPNRVSALPFFRVLRTAFFGKRSNASLLVPTVGLSDLLVHPARTFIESRGGTVTTGSAVSEVIIKGGRAVAVRVGPREVPASSVILAVPHYSITPLLLPSTSPPPFSNFSSSPIITVNLWFDRRVMEPEFVALLNGRLQWAFNRSRIVGHSGDGQYLACVISGAGEYVDEEKDILVRMAIDDLSAVFPAARIAMIRHSLVVKEIKATFTPVPGSEAWRPGPKTDTPGLFLAGDWTNAGYPATIEGAVLSGRSAAEEILKAS
jgi:squalene-associated FAD-dependent desaturase